MQNRNIDILNLHKIIKPENRIIKKNIRKILSNLGCGLYELSIVFCNDEYIKMLNKKYFERNTPTDVIAFPLNPPPSQPIVFSDVYADFQLLGDIVISLDAVKRQAEEYGVSFEYELFNLIVHGILHLCGWKDNTSYLRKKMMKKQEEVLNILNL